MKLKTIYLTSAIMLSTLAAHAQINVVGGSGAKYEFTTIKENPITPVKNQYRSGTCWCFSALSFIESEILSIN